MKKMRIVLFVSAVLFVLFSCKNQFLSEPKFPGDTGTTGRGVVAPEGLRASQGEKRSITLSWSEDPRAALYYIYSADSPLNAFARCGETNSPEFNFNVPPGTTLYYRVSSVLHDGTESAQSVYVMGTSLAQPVISDITDISESGASVTWYMENAFEDSYINNLLYTVYCYNGSIEVAQVALDGNVKENRAVFTNLAPNTRYEYQVEAYLRSDQSVSEKSDKMDAATARRFRPGAPVNLRASRGTAKDKITLTFELPDMVDIALGEGLYDPKPVYFVIKKRFYSESGNNEYQSVCPYFGSTTSKPDHFIGGYVSGKTVEWSDTNVRRGVKYEYQVQSYVDGTVKVISSDASKTSATGWALGEATLSFGKVEYTLKDDVDEYASAKLPLNFEFDPQNISYSYILVETIERLDDGGLNDLSVPFIERPITFDSYDALLAHIPTMDLTEKTTQDNPGRGLYSYKIDILLNDTELDTISALGQVEVSENTNPIIVENFRVQDGYTDKFVLKWDNYSNRKYILYTVDAEGKNPIEIGFVNDNPVDTDTAVNKNFSYSYTAGVTPGLTRYFAIRPLRDIGGGSFKPGQIVYGTTASRTLGVPEVSLPSEGVGSYSDITALWSETQKADTYRVRYRYTEGSDTAYKTVATVKKEALSIDANGKFKYTFKPEGNEIAIAKAGLQIQIQVDALNEGLRAVVGGDEISTSSKEDVITCLVGPAKLDLRASEAVSAQEITVSWSKISGAGGYYVFRRQFNMNNTAEEGTEAVVYYVSNTPAITGKELYKDPVSGSKIDTATVKASVSFADGWYTLKDNYMTDSEYNPGGTYSTYTPAYKDQQNDMAQGCSYRYYVVPIISDSHTVLNSIEFAYNKDSSNKNTGINFYTIQENGVVKYSGAADREKAGFTIGFGQNVTATKGTYVSGIYNESTNNVNNGVRLTWSPPPRLPGGFNPKYTVYRRETGGSKWDKITDVNVNEYSETQQERRRGIAYEYVIGITGSGGSSDPSTNQRFIDNCYKQLDDKGRPKMLGFMLNYVEMDSVSRNEQKVGNDFAEEVKWFSAGIEHRDGTGYKWGIDGYEVWVMNRNIDDGWHKIADIPYARIPDLLNQSIKVTNVAGGNTNVEGVKILEGGLLKVWRDYKHFFKVRSYVLNNNNEKVFCPDPNWSYTYKFGTTETSHIAASNSMQDEYVKWGARQITSDEFIKIVSIYAGRGICDSGRWQSGSATSNASTTWGGSGKVDQVYSYDANTTCTRNFKFSNYKQDLQNKTGQWITFITINGNIWSHCITIFAYPFRYGEDGWVTIKGPWDTPDLYTGQIKFGANKNLSNQNNGGFSWNGNGGLATSISPGDGSATGTITARIAVKYPGTVANPGAAAEVQLAYRGSQTALQFTGQGDNRYQGNDWK
jgi:fibronectin type 3 domain-containing protein